MYCQIAMRQGTKKPPCLVALKVTRLGRRKPPLAGEFTRRGAYRLPKLRERVGARFTRKYRGFRAARLLGFLPLFRAPLDRSLGPGAELALAVHPVVQVAATPGTDPPPGPSTSLDPAAAVAQEIPASMPVITAAADAHAQDRLRPRHTSARSRRGSNAGTARPDDCGSARSVRSSRAHRQSASGARGPSSSRAPRPTCPGDTPSPVQAR